jgi:two-component system sensor histidine kinase KdpD
MAHSPPQPSRAATTYFAVHLLLLVTCISAGYFAHLNGRPVTAALAFVFAVVLVAARYGLKAGLAAGVVVSVIYNLVLSEPFLRFGVQSVDDLVPLLAFNASAVASAYVAGRLRDEARASHEAHLRVESLLTLSQALQKAVDIDVMLTAVRRSAPEVEAIEVHLDDGRVYQLVDQPNLRLIASKFEEHGAGGEIPAPEQRLYLSEQFNHGQVVALTPKLSSNDVAARLAILAIAAERYILMERLVEADVLRRSEAFKTTLLSSVSHDLRTPLSIISASASSLSRYRNSLPDQTQQDLLQSIEQQAARLNHLTGNLLSLGRIEGGLEPENMPEIDALEVIGTALVSVRQAAPERQITKTIATPHAVVRADPSLLEQVFYNVLENAVVHTPSDTPIHVSVTGEDNQLLIAVEDHGSGLSDDQAERIFERFYQVSGGQKVGSGLGLSIARGFARAVAGDLRACARADGGRGSRFELRLPLSQLLESRHDQHLSD